MARPWSARCYGVARPREGSRQNSIGGSGVLSLRHFGLVLFIPWRVGAEESAAAKFGNMVSAGAMLLDRLGPPGFRFNDFGAPRLPYLFTLAREGADGQAVVCPLLRGSSPTRGVAPKQHRGLGRAFTPAFRAGFFIPWRVGAEESAAAKFGNMVSAGAMLLDRLGPPGFRFNDFGAPRLPYLFTLAREGADGQAVVCPLLRGSSPTRGVAPKQHRGLGRAFTPAFRAGSLYPLARGCRRICRGEIWKYGFGRRDAARPARAAWI